ncbi:LytTR family DNA-binding domain-containing protein [Algoriphagus halophytocola]|uniref:LytTR family DNA-binding domain-containing protein n=1 Tax=Algoriphagus halophytocola TaxID=2991499 RepID=A0ABY6MJZ2_9BACT|nr:MULTISPECIES: LytTR family DNA-binding domain-containing protein [unclassified Algoriphagus]UZD23488.1 LytTR family DNA-binding domain-containing protein [Algoriphagus sp. TR-M5]WBL44782.1 LytTR family DNA-binding domain-containing protein [Algoriphagus sp. TR-M9]
MLKAIAIDDENMALEVIKSHASKVPFLELEQVFTDAIDALEYLKCHAIDLIFLDINMPDISGIDFAGLVPGETMVIFTTAYSDYAVKGFELDAIDYLLKPFNLGRFLKACQKAQEWSELRPGNESLFMYLKTSEGQQKIKFSELLCCEATGNYVTFHLRNEKVLSRVTLAEIEKSLPSSFIRTHRSYIVNAALVDKVERHQLIAENQNFPVSLSFMDQVAGFFEKR